MYTVKIRDCGVKHKIDPFYNLLTHAHTCMFTKKRGFKVTNTNCHLFAKGRAKPKVGFLHLAA